MPSRPDAPPAPPAALAQSDELGRWRSLALLLAGLLAESGAARAADAEHRAAERASERAAHQEHLLQDREDFLDIVAHELKTPVAVVKAYAELLEEQLAGPLVSDTARQVVRVILEQVDVMAELIEGVLDVQRLRLGKLPLEIGHVDLPRLARDVADQLQQTSRAHAIRVVADESLPALLADRRRLRQVLSNLLENALKYSDGGEVLVRISPDEWQGQPAARLTVRDHGRGIDPTDLDRIFDRFEQVSDDPVNGRVGLGLGLYVARQIARAHGGEVWAESDGRGRGSTFHLAMPLDAGLDP